MPKKLAQIRNLTKIQQAYKALRNRETEEGLALVWGAPGLGKTTGACHLFVQENGVLVTARPGWRQRALLDALLHQLNGDQRHQTNAQKLDEVIRLVTEFDRPIFVDEADFLFDAGKTTLETLRAIHDASGIPILLVGMTSVGGSVGIDKRIRRYPQIADRVTEWIEFLPCDLSDTRLLAATFVPEVKLAEDLAKWLCSKTKGNVRKIRTELESVKKRAGVLRTTELDLDGYLGRQAAETERKAIMREVS